MTRRNFIAGSGAFGILALSGASRARAADSTDTGQFFLAGFRGTSVADLEVGRAQRLIERGDISGVILLERNIRSPEQLSRLIAALQSASPVLPAIIAIDQEGGRVVRLGAQNGFRTWMSAQSISESGWGDQAIHDYFLARANELAAVGINMNLAPVVDLNVNPANPIIGSKGRSFGQNVEQVIRFAQLFIQAHRAAGVKTCLKHFPGHGSSLDDSHHGSADISETWSAREIAPFDRLAHAGMADSIMNGHLLNKYLSDEPWIPTSLSRAAVREVREGLGFDGIVVADDMQMGAITKFTEPASACIKAVEAGNSLLIYSNYRREHSIESTIEVSRSLREAVGSGKVSIDTIDAEVTRVRAFRGSLIG